MKILVLGMPRTGTQSLADALIRLGVTPVYHMREVRKHNHEALWIQALEAKFDPGDETNTSWSTREDFDRILKGWEAVTDYPAAIFAPELIKAYPEAKVILSVRSSEEQWYKSMCSTLYHAHVNYPQKPLAKSYHHYLWGDNFLAAGIESYRRHNERVREAAAAESRTFLEYRAGEGWERLCAFLGLEVPTEDFPRSDDWVEYKKAHSEESTQ